MNGRTAGFLIAGGASTRFGTPKALATVGGVRVVDRVIAALHAAGLQDVYAMINDPALAAAVGIEHFPDVRPGSGALSGLHGALVNAQRMGYDAIIATGCDMPFLSAPLLRELCAQGADRDAVLPASDGPRGVEPLCAWYSVRCIEAIEAALSRGDARMIGFHRDVRIATVPLARICTYGEPSTLFLNLNTPADLERAEQLL